MSIAENLTAVRVEIARAAVEAGHHRFGMLPTGGFGAFASVARAK